MTGLNGAGTVSTLSQFIDVCSSVVNIVGS